MEPLILSTTDELLVELFKRFDDCFFYGINRNCNDGMDKMSRRWKGENIYLLGMSQDISNLIIEEEREEESPAKE